MAHHDFTMPISEEQARQLRVNDTVTLNGTLFGIRENHTEAEAKAHEPRVKALAAIMAEVKEAKKGMVIVLDMAGGAVQMSIDGKPAGKPIDGAEFSRALLRIWLGDKPVQDDLKKALLGG